MSKSYRLSELAHLIGCTVDGDETVTIDGVDELGNAKKGELSFLANPKYYKKMLSTNASAICIDEKTHKLPHQNYLISNNPSQAFQKAMAFFIQEIPRPSYSGIHPTSVIHKKAQIGKNVTIGPFCVIDQGVVIKENTTLHPHVTIYSGAQIGENCEFHSHSIVREGVIIKNRVILQPGAVIGGCGYGYIQDTTGKHIKVPQMGSVILEDDVEIGSNSTIDRARFKNTIIKRGSKIDNLVMIAHNVEIGEDNLIISQTGIAGSTKTGKHVILAGQTGVSGHLIIGDRVMIAGQSGVHKSILDPGSYMGSPAKPVKEFVKEQSLIKRLVKHIDRLKELEALIEKASC